MGYITSIEQIGIEQGMQQGMQQGLQQGQVEMALRLLEQRFGRLPADLADRIAQLSTAELLALFDAALTAASLDEVVAALPNAAR